MSSGSHRESGLSKSVWSDTDFEEMGWHDATIHGLHVQQTDDVLPRLLFDLDYIVRWVHPVRPAKSFSFWVSPATLVFEEVWELEGELGFKDSSPELEIADVHQLVPDDSRKDLPLWHIEGHAFDLKFRASGFRQYVRHAPRLTPGPVLSSAARGGCCFTEIGFS
ncbi:hypothetical protein PUR61_08240 [Streptomyces sp. BE20]|uniref:hypothetical protein n=1 Tax=unclassified Streptomyces TaxID=2593676 RepID=UPI002E7668FD|nr:MULTISPECIES: hypothetical protein [unclassified Streptomyces]MED7951119.1 hypothetical protein [Streptomyces sp. BE303]MEE1822183.1 hypothetical protein [Streptomyces sp. BE20]